jgi:hypothetical protein
VLYRWHICKNVMAKHRTASLKRTGRRSWHCSQGWCEQAWRTSCRRSWCKFKQSGWVPSRVLCSMCFPGCSTRHTMLAHMLTKCYISSRHPHHMWKTHTQRWSSAYRLALVTWWLWLNVYCNFSPINIKRLILPSHNRMSGAILFTQTCSMTRCVELPSSIWSSLMLWTRLGVREVRWRSSFSESNSVGLLPWPPVLFPYIYCILPSPHRWSDRSLQLLSSRSTFNLRLPKSMQGSKSVRNQTPASRLSWDFLQRPQSTICVLQTRTYQWVRYTSSGGLC